MTMVEDRNYAKSKNQGDLKNNKKVHVVCTDVKLPSTPVGTYYILECAFIGNLIQRTLLAKVETSMVCVTATPNPVGQMDSECTLSIGLALLPSGLSKSDSASVRGIKA